MPFNQDIGLDVQVYECEGFSATLIEYCKATLSSQFLSDSVVIHYGGFHLLRCNCEETGDC